MEARLDAVVVSFQSRGTLRSCVQPLTRMADVRPIVVDNASTDGSLDAVADLPVDRIARSENGGFASACNDGWRAGSAPLVLFLNPDATIDRSSLERLVEALRPDRAGIAAPMILEADGSLAFSQRRLPRLRSTYSQALLLHRIFPRASWSDEVLRDPEAYERSTSPEWVSGACLLVKREVLERVGGLDESFFLYCEDTDLCKRTRDAGWDIRYEPRATCVHQGGTSLPRADLLPLLARSRARYARKHRDPLVAFLERGGIAVGEGVHAAVGRGGPRVRAGHARALWGVLGGRHST